MYLGNRDIALRWYNTASNLLVAYDFQAGDVPGLQFGNPVAGAIARDSLEVVPSGVQRRSPLGLLVETQTTNKCTLSYNKKPTDTSGTTPGAGFTTHEVVARGSLPTALQNQLEAEDPQGTITAMFHSISNASANCLLDGVTGNGNPHTASLWQYVVSGTAGPGIVSSGLNGRGPEGLVRVNYSEALPTTSDRMTMTVLNPTETYWIAHQFEERPERSSVVEIEGSAVTRLGDNPFIAVNGGLDTSAFTCTVGFNKYMETWTGSNARVLQLDDGTDGANKLLTTRIGTPVSNFHQIADGAGAYNGPSSVIGTDNRHAFGISGTDILWAVNGTYVNKYATTVPPDYDFMRFGSIAGGALNFDGYIHNAALWDIDPSISLLEGLSNG